MAQRPDGKGGSVISQTPKSSTFIGSAFLSHPSVQVSTTANAKNDSRLLLTEVANEVCLLRIWCPLSVDHLVIGSNVEPKLLITARKFLVSTFVRFEGIFPSLVAIVTLCNSRNVGFEISIDVEDNSGIKRWSGHCGCLEESRRKSCAPEIFGSVTKLSGSCWKDTTSDVMDGGRPVAPPPGEQHFSELSCTVFDGIIEET